VAEKQRPRRTKRRGERVRVENKTMSENAERREKRYMQERRETAVIYIYMSAAESERRVRKKL